MFNNGIFSFNGCGSPKNSTAESSSSSHGKKSSSNNKASSSGVTSGLEHANEGGCSSSSVLTTSVDASCMASSSGYSSSSNGLRNLSGAKQKTPHCHKDNGNKEERKGSSGLWTSSVRMTQSKKAKAKTKKMKEIARKEVEEKDRTEAAAAKQKGREAGKVLSLDDLRVERLGPRKRMFDLKPQRPTINPDDSFFVRVSASVFVLCSVWLMSHCIKNNSYGRFAAIVLSSISIIIIVLTTIFILNLPRPEKRSRKKR